MPAVTIDSITIEPPMRHWPALTRQQPQGVVLGRSLEEWRRITREELNVAATRLVIATGHQPTLWHPGILAKYAAVDAIVRGPAGESVATLNVVVDQDVVDSAAFDVPASRSDGTLSSRRVDLASIATAADVPIGRVPAFQPRDVQVEPLDGLPELPEAVQWIRAALAAEAKQPNAAEQMSAALSRLMQECAGIERVPTIMASDLMRTTLARGLLRAMADDPQRCAQAYNRAVAAVPEARLAPMAIRNDYVELPLWRMRDADAGAVRIRAYDNDLDAFLATDAAQSKIQNPKSKIAVLPRALFMTALIRLAVADLFVHGTGGAIYDRAMEAWIRDWLGVEVAPMALVTADVRLPLMNEEDAARVDGGGLALARSRQRQLLHDPESANSEQWGNHHPRPIKQGLLRAVDGLPRGSHERRAAFFEMHQRLESMRAGRECAAGIDAMRAEFERLQRLSRDAQIALRRDWAFPLYPPSVLRELVERIRDTTTG